MVGWWFSPGTPVSSTNKPDRHNKTEISLICGKTIIIALVTFQKRLKVMHACICYLATTSGKNTIPSRYIFYSRFLCTQYTISEYYKTATEQPVFSGWPIHHITKSNSIPDSPSSEWVSEWVLINVNSPFFQLYHGENKLIFNEMMMRSTLY